MFGTRTVREDAERLSIYPESRLPPQLERPQAPHGTGNRCLRHMPWIIAISLVGVFAGLWALATVVGMKNSEATDAREAEAPSLHS